MDTTALKSEETLVETLRETKAMFLFFGFFCLYAVAFCVYSAVVINPIICQVFQIVGIVGMLYSVVSLTEWRFESKYFRNIFVLFISWQICTIFRNNNLEYKNIKDMLFGAESGLLLYFIPFIVLVKDKKALIKCVNGFLVIFGLCFVVLTVLFVKKILLLDQTNTADKFVFEVFVKILGLPVGFVILTARHQKKSSVLFAIFILVVEFVLAAYKARRGLLLLTSLQGLLGFILVFGRMSFSLKVVMLLGGLVLLGITYEGGFLRKGVGFDLLSERMTEDTRSGPEDCFYADFQRNDWIFGRGFKGEYYCPNIDLNDTTGYRKMIETDYLNIILKSGIISIVLMLLIMIPAVYLGLLKSRNSLGRASAIWILIWMVSTYPLTVTTFSLNYMLVWISIAICYSPTIREASDEKIKGWFSNEISFTNESS